jgi:hypothetical protein
MALGITVLFAWCKTLQAVFASILRNRLAGEEPGAWTFRRILNCLTVQAAWQATGWILLPVSWVLLLPLPWVIAWLQNLTALADSANGGLWSCARRAGQQAVIWPGQNVVLLALLAGLAMVVALNAAASVLAAPFLLKSFLGIDTHLSLNVGAAINTTFLSVVMTLTWLCMGPLLKAAYVLRCFHGESIATGADLRATLRMARRRHLAGGLAILIGLITVLWQPAPASAAFPPASASESYHALDDALDEVLARPEFAWRIQADDPIPPPDEGSAIDRLLEQVRQWLFALGRTVRDWIDRVLEWLERVFRPRPVATRSLPLLDWLATPGLLMAMGTIIVLGAVGWILWTWLRQRPVPTVAALATPLIPNIADEDLDAGQLPEDAWRRMADELLRSGQPRLAVRALYLASLAHLATRNLVHVARAKSNSEYLSEFRRRSRDQPERVEAFERLVTAFERVWYGVHSATGDLWDEVEASVRRIRA